MPLEQSNSRNGFSEPPATTLQPQLFIRNVTSKPVDATLAFNWRTSTNTGRSPGPGPVLHLSPFETRWIDVAALQDGKTLPKNAQWSSVILTTNSLPGEVVAVAASYDKSLHYGAQTPFSDQLAFHYAGSQWQYDPLHDSMITVGNGGTKPTLAALTIFYNQGTQMYELEQTLQPDEQMWIDVGRLIRESIPDKNGKSLPADLTSGSYEIRDLNNHIGTLFEGKVIYDKTSGHVTYGCQICCGFRRLAMFFNPLAIPFTSTAGNGVQGQDACSLQYTDISGDFLGDWSTANSSIATVDYSGTHTGQGVGGSTTSSTFADEQWYISKYSCPIMTRHSTGGDNVQSPTYFFSPSATQTNAPPACTLETGYFIDVSYYVADANSGRVSQSGMAPGENMGDGKGWHDDFAKPTTTGSDGSFHDTPNGSCYGTSGHYCENANGQSFRLTSNGTVFPIATNTTRRTCTDGVKVVIQGNPAAQNKTYTFGNTQ